MREKKPEAKCECGASLPTHLLGLGLTKHVCSCNRAYVEKKGVFVPNGTAPNPFVDYEREHGGVK